MSLLDRFKNKPKESKSISVDEIKDMTSKGISDKDIIRTLKDRGYEYDEIEKSMLQAVKDGVSEEPIPEPQPQSMPQEASQTQSTEEVKFDDPLAPQQPQQEFAPPEFNESQAEMHEDISPEIIVEELVEGVVQEKWIKFEDKIVNMEKVIEELKIEIRQIQQKTSEMKPSEDIGEMGVAVSEFAEKMEDFEARVGGLEKAFRQFLPSLTSNIENLSSIVHEIKSKEKY